MLTKNLKINKKRNFKTGLKTQANSRRCVESQAWVSSCERIPCMYRVLSIDLNLAVKYTIYAWTDSGMHPAFHRSPQVVHLRI